MESRFKHIDIAKGISITLVAVFHSKFATFFPDVNHSMALFRMPLFFFLSGIFFSWLVEPRSFLLKKSEALLKPYFAVLFLHLALCALKGDDNLGLQLAGIFYGNGQTIVWGALWFLTHLFTVYCFCYLCFRFAKFSNLTPLKLGTVAFVFMLTGSVFINVFWGVKININTQSLSLPGLPFSLDIVLITSAYFILGVALKEKVTGFRPCVVALLSSLILFLYVSQYTNAHIDFNKRIYDNPLYSTLGALGGIYIVITIAYFMSKVNWFSYLPILLGKSSIYILIFHIPIGTITFKYLSNGVNESNILFYFSLISFLFSLVFPMLIKKMVESSDILSLAFLPFKTNKLVIKVTKGSQNIGL